MFFVNEKSSAYLNLTFRDKGKAMVAPAAVSYRIDCMTSQQQIKAWTALTPAASVEIVLSASDTAIINDAHAHERRRVTVVASYGSGNSDQATDEFDYDVRNLRYLT